MSPSETRSLSSRIFMRRPPSGEPARVAEHIIRWDDCQFQARRGELRGIDAYVFRLVHSPCLTACNRHSASLQTAQGWLSEGLLYVTVARVMFY